MPDDEEGREVFSNELSERLRTLDSLVSYALSNLVEKSGDILKEGLGDKLLNALESKVNKLRIPIEQAMSQMERENIKILKEAGELRLSLFSSAEERKLIKFDSHLKEEEKLLKDSYNITKSTLLEGFEGERGIKSKLKKLSKEHQQDLTELHEKGQKERLRLALENEAAQGSIGASVKLEGLKIVDSWKQTLSLIGIWTIKTGIQQIVETAPAMAGVLAARTQALGMGGIGQGAGW